MESERYGYRLEADDPQETVPFARIDGPPNPPGRGSGWWDGGSEDHDLLGSIRSTLGVAHRSAVLASLRFENLNAERSGGVMVSATYKLGDPGDPVDAIVHTAMETHLRTYIPEAVLLGEEAFRSAYVGSQKLIFLADPIDGTLPYLVGGSWGSVLLVYQNLNRVLTLVGGGIVNQSGHIVLVDMSRDAVGLVFCGNLSEDPQTDLLVSSPSNLIAARPTFAMVGLKPRDRLDFVAFETALGASANVSNFGGSPMAFHLLQAYLNASVSLRAQAPWDGFATKAVSAAGGVVGSLDGQLFSIREVGGWFATAPLGEDIKTVPANVAASDENSYQLAVAALRQAGLARRHQPMLRPATPATEDQCPGPLDPGKTR